MGHIKPRAPVPPTGGPHGPRGKRNPDDTQEQLDEALWHQCPFQIEINNDHDFVCQCSARDEEQCRRDI